MRDAGTGHRIYLTEEVGIGNLARRVKVRDISLLNSKLNYERIIAVFMD